MAIIGDALRQAFMLKHDYAILRDEQKAWIKLRTPISIFFLTFVSLSIFFSTAIGFKIVFPSDSETRPFCTDPPIEKDPEIAGFYWMIVFVPSAIVSFFSAIYLVAAAAQYHCSDVTKFNHWG
ncbi:hypothetical protein L1987_86856 [Smallanthus sonchifolius]|uniref:Uncharacterized protein n=1 Tax=Smallanthus sonchifolius TaxID=185202 RepID=A0ACB8Y170_9ASTR|nr:hypothetical protein L1987_86856 [Smallanthus sonchifolius]